MTKKDDILFMLAVLCVICAVLGSLALAGNNEIKRISIYDIQVAKSNAAALKLLGFVPAIPQALTNVLVEWDHPFPLPQTFEFVHKTNANAPWEFYMNVVGTNAAIFTKRYPTEVFTIRRTWFTGYTNFASGDPVLVRGE